MVKHGMYVLRVYIIMMRRWAAEEDAEADYLIMGPLAKAAEAAAAAAACNRIWLCGVESSHVVCGWTATTNGYRYSYYTVRFK